MKPSLYFLIISGVLMTLGCQQPSPTGKGWTHYSVDPVMPGSSWGTGGPVLMDFDGDGDLDIAVSRRNTQEAYWYQRINDSTWIPHVMGQSAYLQNTLGATGADMDRDGLVDVVFSNVWFKNPGKLDAYPEQKWAVNDFPGAGHDIVSVDINRDGVIDVVVYNGKKLAWYDPEDSLREHMISAGYSDHGGLAPHGFGDIDQDGTPDLVIPGYWFANPGDTATEWARHEWPFDSVTYSSYGRSIRSFVIDINGDGKNDIVYGHCDTGGSHVYWIQNMDNGMNWEPHKLQDPEVRNGDVEGTGSFHSLGVADFDQDGDLDIFAGEQEDPDTYMEESGRVAMKPRGLKERGVLWHNSGGSEIQFKPAVIHVDNPGWHDIQMGDVDGDGDIDIVSKIWNADGPVYHMDLWRNELIR